MAKQRRAIVGHRRTLIPRKPDRQEGKCKQKTATVEDESYSGCFRLARKVFKNCVRTNNVFIDGKHKWKFPRVLNMRRNKAHVKLTKSLRGLKSQYEKLSSFC